MYDSFGRKIDYLRISVTDKCNLRCVYCMPPEGVPLLRHEELLSFEEIVSAARAAAALGVTKIRLTGGEPLVRRGLPELVRMLARIPGLDTLAMTTNATLLAPLAGELVQAGLSSINISLDTLDPARYSLLTRGGRLEQALEGIEAARALAIPLKINMVVFPHSEAEGQEVLAAGLAGGFAVGLAGGRATSAKEIEAMRAWCDTIGAKLQRIAQYSLESDKSDGHSCERPPPCSVCNRIRLTADGRLRPCLRSEIEVPFDPENAEESIRQALARKPALGGVCSDRKIIQIGG